MEVRADRRARCGDYDQTVSDERAPFVEVTLRGSACSIELGDGISTPSTGLGVARHRVTDVQSFPWGSFVFRGDVDRDGWAAQQPLRGS